MSLTASIRSDHQEHQRVYLEHNLPDLPIHLSDSDPSVEFPRHNHHPHQDSFSFPADNTDVHPWSYRSADVDDAVNPYPGGETVSTAAHHASALTLSAGLGLGKGVRRDPSVSGAEYDPERPLGEMMAAMDGFSLFDVEPSKSRYPVSTVFSLRLTTHSSQARHIVRSRHSRQHGGFRPHNSLRALFSPLFIDIHIFRYATSSKTLRRPAPRCILPHSSQECTV
jgi:hypothetical protein